MNEATRKLAKAREKFNYSYGMSDIADAREAIDVLFDVVSDLVQNSPAPVATPAAAVQQPDTATTATQSLLPPPDAGGDYVYPDGSWILASKSGWVARWCPKPGSPIGSMLTWEFNSPEAAAKALLQGGEGPASLGRSVARFWRAMRLQQKAVDDQVQLRNLDSSSDLASVTITLRDEKYYHPKILRCLAKLLCQLPRIMDFIEAVAAGNTEINDLEVTAAKLIAELSA